MVSKIGMVDEPFLGGFGTPFKNFGIVSTTNAGTDINTILDNLHDGKACYFSFAVDGSLSEPSMGANASFWYGYTNANGRYGWIRGESYNKAKRGVRQSASTYTWDS